MPRFTLVIARPPDAELGPQRLALALLRAGAAIDTVFLLRAGVAHAAAGTAAAQAWRLLADYPSPPRLLACSAAVERRRLSEQLDVATFDIVGLGQLVEALADCDRVIEFPD